MYVVLTVLAAVPLLIVAQMLRIHLADGSQLRAKGERQASSFVSIPAIRGAIVDRYGRTLAVNTARYDLAVDPTIDGFKDVETSFFERLSRLTGVPAASYRRQVRPRSIQKYVLLVRASTDYRKCVV